MSECRSMPEHIDLFPLDTVLFPHGLAPLRIFEPRYLDMVSRCLKKESTFGICLRKKSESDALLDHIHRIGTTCNIIDWEGLEKGFLGILVEGGERFTVHDIRVLENRLWTARVTEIEDLPDRNPALPGEFRDMAMLLEKILARLKPVYKSEWLIDDSKWVGSQLAAPLPLTDKH